MKLSILTYAGIEIKSRWFELSHNTLCIQFLIFDKSFYKAFQRNTNIYKTIQRNFLKAGTERRKVGGVMWGDFEPLYSNAPVQTVGLLI